MRRITFLVTAMGTLAAVAACGSGQAVVTAEVDVPDPESGEETTRALSGLEVHFLPYDRDAIFDSLEAAHPEPEPAIPDSLLEAREEVALAQQEWRQAETRWNSLRDTLQSLTEEMEQYSRGENRYIQLFRQFQDLEGELEQVEEEMNQAFERFDSLQQGIIAQSDQIRLERENWADEAFAEAAAVVERKIDESGQEPVVDTTDASGTVDVALPPGEWWVHSRQELSYNELYWNVPIRVERGQTVELLLNRENAEARPAL